MRIGLHGPLLLRRVWKSCRAAPSCLHDCLHGNIPDPPSTHLIQAWRWNRTKQLPTQWISHAAGHQAHADLEGGKQAKWWVQVAHTEKGAQERQLLLMLVKKVCLLLETQVQSACLRKDWVQFYLFHCLQAKPTLTGHEAATRTPPITVHGRKR